MACLKSPCLPSPAWERDAPNLYEVETINSQPLVGWGSRDPTPAEELSVVSDLWGRRVIFFSRVATGKFTTLQETAISLLSVCHPN